MRHFLEILQLATRTEQDRMANASLNESTSMRKPEMPGEGNVRSATTRSTRRRLSLPFHPSEIRFKSCRPCRSPYFTILDRHGSATNEINKKKKSKREKNNEKRLIHQFCVSVSALLCSGSTNFLVSYQIVYVFSSGGWGILLLLVHH